MEPAINVSPATINFTIKHLEYLWQWQTLICQIVNKMQSGKRKSLLYKQRHHICSHRKSYSLLKKDFQKFYINVVNKKVKHCDNVIRSVYLFCISVFTYNVSHAFFIAIKLYICLPFFKQKHYELISLIFSIILNGVWSCIALKYHRFARR